MENKYLYSDSTNIFDDKELEFRVSQINDEGTNIKEVFEANLISYVRHKKKFSSDWRIEEQNISLWLYDEYTIGSLQVDDFEYQETESPCSEFISAEQFHFLLEGSPKCELYNNFINTHKRTFQLIDSLVNYRFAIKKNKDSFLVFASKSLKNRMVNYEGLEAAFEALENMVINKTVADLIHFLQIIKKADYSSEVNKVFNMDYFLNPALIQNPLELRNYREAIRAWVNKMGQDLKYKLNLPSVPPILVWMAAEIAKTNPLDEIQNETKDYPKYIFANYKAFDLFDTIAKEMTTHPQISFLFRQMSEKEKPALIVVENSDFVKWFNQQNYGYTLDYTTKTYEQSKTEDRIALYNVVKNLKMST